MRRIDYIEVYDEISSGGTASVYFGIDTRGSKSGLPVAVKELSAESISNPRALEWLKREANIYLKLDHPNIVKLQNLLLLKEGSFLVMDYLEGLNLKQYIRENGGMLSFSTAVFFMSEVSEALSYAHDQEVIHLDIKPSNIIYSNTNEIKLIDFGISVEGSEILNNPIMGSPYYMSPEQIRGIGLNPIDHRSDIYSMGVTLYELVAGKPPFSGGHYSRNEVLEMAQTQKLPLVKTNSSHDMQFLNIMNKIIQKATAKSADARYQSCAEFSEDLSMIG